MSEERVRALRRDIKRGDLVEVEGCEMELESGMTPVLHLTHFRFVAMRTGGNTGVWGRRECDDDETGAEAEGVVCDQAAENNPAPEPLPKRQRLGVPPSESLGALMAAMRARGDEIRSLFRHAADQCTLHPVLLISLSALAAR